MIKMNADSRKNIESVNYVQKELPRHSVKYFRILKLVKIAVVLKIVALLILIISRLL
jgi:hypothetical protein